MTMTRAQAAQAGLNKYDTGKPCKNGHRAMRYTQSGTCEGCLRASQQRAQAVHAASAPERAARKQFALHVVSVAERVPDAQLGSLQTMAEALLSCRFPSLAGLVEFRCNPRPCKAVAGTIQATFLVHVEDRQAFHGLCDNALRAASMIDAHGLAARMESVQ